MGPQAGVSQGQDLSPRPSAPVGEVVATTVGFDCLHQGDDE